MSEGFRQAGGFTPVLAVEWDKAAAATYAANFGESHVIWGDIAEVPDERIPPADVIIGGPPCQGFSNLGSRDVNDPRNQLWKQYLRFVQKAKPKVFVVENVERFRRSAEFELLKAEEHGGLLDEYELTDGLLLAADYGVPQRRPRAIVIGSRIGKIPLPEQTHSRDGAVPGSLPTVPETTVLPRSFAEFFGVEVPGIYKAMDLHIGRTPTNRSLERYDSVPPGGGRFNVPYHLLPDCWRNKPTGTTDVMGRMQWDQPSLTIRTEFFKPEKGQYLHPQWDPKDSKNRVNRVITHLEAALLQDFPMIFQWCGTKIQIAKQIGNAVPVGLSRSIALHLRTYLD